MYLFTLLAVLLIDGGQAEHDDDTRGGIPLISGGDNTRAQKAPWNVGIYEAVGSGLGHRLLCSGTLIAPDLAVTAAMCFGELDDNVNVTRYDVGVGKYYREWDVDTYAPQVQRFKVKQVVRHPRYGGEATHYENNIALVQMASSAVMTSTVRAVRLDWGRTALAAGTQGEVAGWGSTDDDDNLSFALQSVRLPHVDGVICNNATTPAIRRLITRNTFCAGYVNTSKSTCPGDTGAGYVVVDAVTNSSVVVGVVSVSLQPREHTGYSCYTRHYALFTDLTAQAYLDWIKRLFPSAAREENNPSPGRLTNKKPSSLR